MGRNRHRACYAETEVNERTVNESVLIVGGGGREHALGWKLAQSPHVKEIYAAPGNAGLETLGACVDIPADNVEGLRDFADKHVDFTVVGPDKPLALEIVDEFQRHDLLIFGPLKRAAKLEWSNVFANDFMDWHGIPHPAGTVCRDYSAANDYITTRDPVEYVIKADGLADGKGVLLPKSPDEAREFVHNLMIRRIFGEAGKTVLFQERLQGEELSVFAISDGLNFTLLPSFRDYKRRNDGDTGLNTGGMGAYRPVELPEHTTQYIKQRIIQPTLDGIRPPSGIGYRGVLYVGLMLTADGPKVLEYNARFGDPETQAMVMVLQNDLYPVLRQRAAGFAKGELSWQGAAVTVALTEAHYPEISKVDEPYPIHGLDTVSPDVQVFHGATKRQGKTIYGLGGRTLHIAARGETVAEAREKVYESIGKQAIHFAGMHYRKDIAQNL